MNDKLKDFYGDKNAITDPALLEFTGKADVCPNCGTRHVPTPPLEPNVKMKEFYGGRIKFFKIASCKCGAKYKLCIEKKYNAKEAKDEFKVVDMIILEKGKTRDEMIEERIHKEFENGRVPSMEEREKIKDETVLATILDLDTKIQALCMYTTMELQAMCKKEKIKYLEKDNKTILAKKLLAKNPNLVTAD